MTMRTERGQRTQAKNGAGPAPDCIENLIGTLRHFTLAQPFLR
jgi:hypothetical protein